MVAFSLFCGNYAAAVVSSENDLKKPSTNAKCCSHEWNDFVKFHRKHHNVCHTLSQGFSLRSSSRVLVFSFLVRVHCKGSWPKGMKWAQSGWRHVGTPCHEQTPGSSLSPKHRSHCAVSCQDMECIHGHSFRSLHKMSSMQLKYGEKCLIKCWITCQCTPLTVYYSCCF